MSTIGVARRHFRECCRVPGSSQTPAGGDEIYLAASPRFDADALAAPTSTATPAPS